MKAAASSGWPCSDRQRGRCRWRIEAIRSGWLYRSVGVFLRGAWYTSVARTRFSPGRRSEQCRLGGGAESPSLGRPVTRSALKHREQGTLLALGATRMDLARRSVVEILVLAAVGGLVGLIAARWLVTFIVRLGPGDVPRLADVAINLPVAGFTLLVVALSAILCGVVPILHTNAANVAQVLNDAAGATAGPRSQRTRSALVILQISLAVVLLVAAGLIVRSFNNLRRLDLGFNPTKC
jgi:FtsX-like permease family protein